MSDFDSQLAVTVGSTPTLIYTAGVDVVSLSLLMTNGHYGSLPITAYVKRGDQTIYLAKNVRVKKGQSFDLQRGAKLALLAGDEVYAQCPVANVFTGILSAYRDS